MIAVLHIELFNLDKTDSKLYETCWEPHGICWELHRTGWEPLGTEWGPIGQDLTFMRHTFEIEDSDL